jgi:hypothetical protein
MLWLNTNLPCVVAVARALREVLNKRYFSDTTGKIKAQIELGEYFVDYVVVATDNAEAAHSYAAVANPRRASAHFQLEDFGEMGSSSLVSIGGRSCAGISSRQVQ